MPPQEPVHQCRCRVLYGDTDAGGVVYYASYLRFFELGRTEFMRERAVPYRDIADRGFILPVVECHARYKASAFYDDRVLIETVLAEAGKVSCRFTYRLFRDNEETAGRRRLLVKGHTVHAVVDATGRLARLPADLLDRLNALLPP